jgi:hypothetical protein
MSPQTKRYCPKHPRSQLTAELLGAVRKRPATPQLGQAAPSDGETRVDLEILYKGYCGASSERHDVYWSEWRENVELLATVPADAPPRSQYAA